MIEKTTALFALIGDNLAHDKRPQIINYLFGQGDDDAALIPMNIRPDDLPFTLKGLKKSQIKGALIDSVHYEEAALSCDNLSPSAKVANLVDTIDIIDEQLMGFFHLPQDLCEGLMLQDKKVLIIGTTSLAFALAASLTTYPITSLTCAAPTLESAMMITSKLEKKCIIDEEWFSTMRKIDLSNYDIIINATMSSSNEKNDLPLFSNEDATKKFVDFTLTQNETYFSKTASQVGAKAILGYDIVALQARGAYKRWLHKDAIVDNEYQTIITEDFTRECQLTKGLTNG